ncbi:MAG: DUF1501 domain-containing protein [Planctomycetota bacterium]|nr:MAG: DUF1501 domain-containing protein [Planctomycetota bacterium]
MAETPTFTRRQFGACLAAGAMAFGFPGKGIRRFASETKPGSFGPAKRVIFLTMVGGVSQFETLDFKPMLSKHHGKAMPERYTKGQRLAQIRGQELRIVGSPYAFQKYGESGAEISELLPHLAGVADHLCIVRSAFSEAINHDPAIHFLQTGSILPGRPCFGAWAAHALGGDNPDLPAYVVLTSGKDRALNLHARYWGSGFLPSRHQGVWFRAQGDPVLFLADPQQLPRALRRRQLDALIQLNQQQGRKWGDPETETRSQAYEMAFRMQASVPDLLDVSSENPAALAAYGPEVERPGSFAAHCLLARRMAERGVRFIQLFHRGWDQHRDIPKDLPRQCREVDQPCAALLNDLHQRGMLDETLVVWTGEFGRSPMLQGYLSPQRYGRDHHMKCFSLWMAGGGLKAGITVGGSDELGYEPVLEPISMHDLQATWLHCLGLDHERLVYRFQGRDHRLTDVGGQVQRQLLA